jgi:hypothetical protein
MKKQILTRNATLELLKKIIELSAGDSMTLYLPPHLSKEEIAVMPGGIPAEAEITDKLIEIATTSPNGAAVFQSDAAKYIIIPPFPVAEKVIFSGIDVTPLESLLTKDYYIGVVLVRLGAYATGVCRGEKLVSSKAGTGLVHGRHRQGGSSAHRFERHRDKQIEQFLIRVCGHAREQIEPYVKTLDYMVYGGARKTILMAQKYCPFLMKLDTPSLPPLLDIPDPRQAVLESAVTRIWSSTVYEWRED